MSLRAAAVDGEGGRREVTRALAPWRAQLRRQSLLTWAARGAVGGMVVACLVGLAVRLTPLPEAPLLAGAVLALALLAGGLVGLLRGPSAYQTARRVDQQLGLADRLASAWEATGERWPLARPLADDGLGRLGGHRPGRDLPVRLPRHEARALAVLLAVALLVWALPNPMDEVLRQRAEAQAKAAAAAEKVKEAEKVAAEAAALSPEERREIEAVLDKLQGELAHATSEREALTALSEAEERLRELGDPAAKDKAAVLNSLARSLSAEELTAGAGEAIGRGDAEGTREALAELGQSLGQLSAEERGRLTQALQTAANEVVAGGAGQAGLSGRLREAARAIAGGDAAAGAQALGDVADEVAEMEEAAAGEEQLAQVTRGVRSAREGVAGAGGEASAAGSGEGQEASGSGSGDSSGSGEGQGAGQGAGQGQGQGQGSGQGAGQGAGAAGQSGAGGGKGGREGGTGAGGPALGGETARLGGGDETLFIPGQEGGGPSEQASFTTEPPATAFRPYSEVVGQYSEAARDHLDRSPIPPALKETVRQYFADLEE